MFEWMHEKPSPIDRRRSLDGVPVRNQGLRTVPEASGRLRLVVPMRRTGSFWSRFLPPVMERSVRLDDLGAFVFERIDGRRRVLDIVNEFAEHYRVNRREAELSTAEFLRSLAERQFISIVIR